MNYFHLGLKSVWTQIIHFGPYWVLVQKGHAGNGSGPKVAVYLYSSPYECIVDYFYFLLHHHSIRAGVQPSGQASHHPLCSAVGQSTGTCY